MRIQRLLVLAIILFGELYGETQFDYSTALLRDMSDSFFNALKQEAPDKPIDFELAARQHKNYSNVVRNLVSNTIVLDADPHHPDCNFIEDTAILIEDKAVISRMGAKSRRGEELAVARVLKKLKLFNIYHLTSPATMDGGDILYTGHHLFVGQSTRTNKEAYAQLSLIFSEDLPVVPIEVNGSLHLKSILSQLDSDTLVVSDDIEGHRVKSAIESVAPFYKFILVPNRVSANVLRIRKTVIIQSGFPESEAILRRAAEERNLEVVTLEMGELIKADGALTCGSLLSGHSR